MFFVRLSIRFLAAIAFSFKLWPAFLSISVCNPVSSSNIGWPQSFATINSISIFLKPEPSWSCCSLMSALHAFLFILYLGSCARSCLPSGWLLACLFLWKGCWFVALSCLSPPWPVDLSTLSCLWNSWLLLPSFHKRIPQACSLVWTSQCR